MLNGPFSPWPSYTEEEIAAVSALLRSGRVNYWTGTEAREFEKEFVNQGPTDNRNIEATLAVGWQLLSMLPKEELTRVSPKEIEQYYVENYVPH